MDQELTLFGEKEKQLNYKKLYQYIKQELELHDLNPFEQWKETVWIENKGNTTWFWFKNKRGVEYGVPLTKGEWYE